jgi:hypothetical protein
MQEKNNHRGISVLLLLFVSGFLAIPFISSCGKNGNVNPSTLDIQYQVINLSPNLGSVDLYVHYIKVNTSSYFYPTPSGYFYLTNIDTPFQIRPGTTLVPGVVPPSYNIFTLNHTLQQHYKYTLMITGILTAAGGTAGLDTIFTTDYYPALPAPTLGRGKIRFINASPGSGGYDLTANDTTAFSNIPYRGVSAFKELPAGTYDFRIYPNGSSSILRDIPNITIQDGRFYTLYCYGLAGQTDSLAFGSGVITNK